MFVCTLEKIFPKSRERVQHGVKNDNHFIVCRLQRNLIYLNESARFVVNKNPDRNHINKPTTFNYRIKRREEQIKLCGGGGKCGRWKSLSHSGIGYGVGINQQQMRIQKHLPPHQPQLTHGNLMIVGRKVGLMDTNGRRLMGLGRLTNGRRRPAHMPG